MRFAVISEENDIQHRLAKPNYPWANGPVQRINQVIKEATVTRYHYETRSELRQYLANIVAAYSFVRRLKPPPELTTYETAFYAWDQRLRLEITMFIIDTNCQMSGLNV